MKKFAVFDIDGTLIRWQLYHSLIDKLAKKGALGNHVSDKLNKARMKWKRRESDEGFHEYELSLIEVYENAIETISLKVFDDAVDEVIDQYKDQTYTYTRDLLQQLKSEKYLLFAISGSHHELVAKIAEHYGFDDFVGTTYVRDDDNFTGEKVFYAHDKGKALKDMTQKHRTSWNGSYGIGDSRSDAKLLELVENPVAFNPDKILFAEAKKHGWPIVIERKNMIYKLEYKDGLYSLA